MVRAPDSYSGSSGFESRTEARRLCTDSGGEQSPPPRTPEGGRSLRIGLCSWPESHAKGSPRRNQCGEFKSPNGQRQMTLCSAWIPLSVEFSSRLTLHEARSSSPTGSADTSCVRAPDLLSRTAEMHSVSFGRGSRTFCLWMVLSLMIRSRLSNTGTS